MNQVVEHAMKNLPVYQVRLTRLVGGVQTNQAFAVADSISPNHFARWASKFFSLWHSFEAHCNSVACVPSAGLMAVHLSRPFAEV